MEDILQKGVVKFENKVDFNFLSTLLDRNHFISQFTSNWLKDYVFNSVFRIKAVQYDPFFIDTYKSLQEKYNSGNLPADLDIFFSYKMGATSITHMDTYDVIIIGLYGETTYNLEGKEYRVCPGDLLQIPKGVTHTAIGMTPRIILSYGIYNN